MSLDKFLDRDYDLHRYNCGHFVAEVYLEKTGVDITDICNAFLSGDLAAYKETRSKRKRLDGPISPCVVVMQAEHLTTHAGIFIDGSVMHLTQHGVRFEPLSELDPRYRMSFYQ